ncbi:VOC family protein [Nannocystis pusilla]|uniref:VOC family protein n=1 Tax=Nannocystis pusilla TaxID=889268 RepID=A0ABS7TIT1_9BACT|nr:VOC family protein [Nannocystis pusilla]MBZ5708112.1 VOC family protein [Nannocystis pusilla]
MARKFFVSLPVRDLPKSMAFFTALGFEFDPKLTGDHSACMIMSEGASVMLLTESFFGGFTKRELCDTRTQEEALFSFSVASRSDVDAIVAKAVAHGGVSAGPPEDHGFMYDHGFYDLDGHGWNVVWSDPSAT